MNTRLITERRHRDARDCGLTACETCHGEGQVPTDSGPAPRYYTCPDCDGAGYFQNEGIAA